MTFHGEDISFSALLCNVLGIYQNVLLRVFSSANSCVGMPLPMEEPQKAFDFQTILDVEKFSLTYLPDRVRWFEIWQLIQTCQTKMCSKKLNNLFRKIQINHVHLSICK